MYGTPADAGLEGQRPVSSPALTVRANATLAEAARIRARGGVKWLPVVDETGLLEGVVRSAI